MKHREPAHPQESEELHGKMFRLKREAIRQFDILKAEQGPRSGPRLMAEAVDLLLDHYGKKPVGAPVRAAGKCLRPGQKPAPG